MASSGSLLASLWESRGLLSKWDRGSLRPTAPCEQLISRPFCPGEFSNGQPVPGVLCKLATPVGVEGGVKEMGKGRCEGSDPDQLKSGPFLPQSITEGNQEGKQESPRNSSHWLASHALPAHATRDHLLRDGPGRLPQNHCSRKCPTDVPMVNFLSLRFPDDSSV